MNNKQSGNIGVAKPAANDEPINIRALLIKYASYWPFFLVSLAIAFAIAIFYTKYFAPPSEVLATLMIEDHGTQPNEQKSSLVDFQALEQVNAPKVVENEIEVLRSNQLIKDVVNYFQLWADYKLKGGIIKDQDLYSKSPVRINLIEVSTPIASQKINLRIADTGSYVLLEAKGKTIKRRFGDTIDNMGCRWTISANADLAHYIGDEIEIDVTDPEATVLGYQNRLKIEPQEKPATVINISLSDPNIKKSQDFINYLIFFYKKADLAEKGKITKSTLDFIDNRLASLSGQLNHAESNIEGFRSANGLTDINAQSQMYLQGMQTNGEKLNEINTQLSVINKLENYLNEPGNNSTIPSTVGITDQHLSELVQKLSDVELERNRLLATLPEKNPAFDPINRQIGLLKQEIKDGISGIKSSLSTMQKSVESYKSSIQSAIKSVPLQEHQLTGMSRQQSTKSSLYDYLLQQREAISLSYASSASAVRLVDAAHILPMKASKKLIPFGAALLLGLIFPAGFIYGRDLIKNSVTTRKSIELNTGLPVIAEISYIKLPSEIAFANRDNPESFPLIEQFRHLRTQVNLAKNSPDNQGFAILLTSSVANEGKSMISTNLAVALASTGKKTLLVEMDIYKPAVSKVFGLPASSGITDYLNGQNRLAGVVQETALYPNLNIIGSGAFVDNFSELLDQDRFGNMVSELKTKYDYILFDTPPVHAINDAFIIANHCDLTLYVTRFNHTSNSLLPFIHKLNADESLPNMKIVFNGLADGRDGEGFKYENYYKRPTS
ncbi:GumC family protein [Mucilaginibacter sp. L3T2-6]|uniref:GumC family protein n=1 Tax=Mucilaginibacter sp. L3T2-6 TaxID=3062491 RepID=UPI002676C049|nr:polysaccharide biosynthesis tyrosine autokinase [Mucilaginibacter sp. L3T2-6]MDO3643702.1 polysaccharide biosynthesis tyrosine autokinase [Mucilaginibacter sp. L3T2-6]MDV6216050.1 polysaccharide biosynthesis tyrosine autokinase [Mucilaginibacter sp. L3T2-6]